MEVYKAKRLRLCVPDRDGIAAEPLSGIARVGTRPKSDERECPIDVWIGQRTISMRPGDLQSYRAWAQIEPPAAIVRQAGVNMPSGVRTAQESRGTARMTHHSGGSSNKMRLSPAKPAVDRFPHSGNTAQEPNRLEQHQLAEGRVEKGTFFDLFAIRVDKMNRLLNRSLAAGVGEGDL